MNYELGPEMRYWTTSVGPRMAWKMFCDSLPEAKANTGVYFTQCLSIKRREGINKVCLFKQNNDPHCLKRSNRIFYCGRLRIIKSCIISTWYNVFIELIPKWSSDVWCWMLFQVFDVINIGVTSKELVWPSYLLLGYYWVLIVVVHLTVVTAAD